MQFVSDKTLFRACRILFGPDVMLNRSFLYYLQPSGISNAFRKRALDTHPDRVAMLDEATRKKCTNLFIEADWAREQLISFCRKRDSGSPPPARKKRPEAWETTDRQEHRGREHAQQQPQGARQGQSKFHSGVVPQRRLFFGEYLYYSGEVPWNAFIKAIVWQRRQRPRFGEIARRWRYLTDSEMRMIMLRKKYCEPIGETAVRTHSLNQFQVNTILFHQMFIQKPIGEYFIEKGHLTKDRVNELLETFRQHNAGFAVAK